MKNLILAIVWNQSIII